MKPKTTLLITFIFCISQSFAQDWALVGNPGTNSAINFLGTTDNQQLKFKTNNVLRMSISPLTGVVAIGDLDPDGVPNYGGLLRLRSSTYSTAIDLIRNPNATGSGWDNQIRFYSATNLRHLIADDYGTGKLVIAPGYDANSSAIKILDIRGKVQIGDDINTYPAPSGYGLYVQYGILTEKVKVAIKTTGDWSDFVFNKNYTLRPLREVEKFILANKHLPDMPSAEQVVKEGIDLAQMDAKLLQKIEELTLYVIELKKENEQMKKQIEALQKK